VIDIRYSMQLTVCDVQHRIDLAMNI